MGSGGSGHRTGSSGRPELTQLLGKVPTAATSPQLSTGSPPCALSKLGFVPGFQLPAQLPHGCQSRAGTSPSYDPAVPSEAQHSGFWERWCGGKPRVVVGRLPSSTSREQRQQRYSSASGGGVRCSWKFSFWKTLLVAGSPWETLSSPCLSPPPWPPRASSVRRASCKENPRSPWEHSCTVHRAQGVTVSLLQ